VAGWLPQTQEVSDLFNVKSNRFRRLRENIIYGLLFLCGFVSVLTTIAIIVSLFSEAIAFFQRPEVNLWAYLTGTTWKPTITPAKPENFGVLPLINGTLMIAVISGLISIPLGVASATYLSEYADERVRHFLKPTLEILAGVPTVVFGYFAITTITPIITSIVDWYNAATGASVNVGFFNALSASIVVGIMIIPTVASISEDAMRAVPRALREGAYALGATKFEVASKVVVPAALSGIIAAFILGISRAVGETMAVSIAAGATPRMTLNPLDSIQTMTAFIVQVSFGDAPVGSLNSQSIFAVGATLFLITFVMNVISQLVLRRFREAYD
jgi:phosphate transport system permease protein